MNTAINIEPRDSINTERQRLVNRVNDARVAWMNAEDRSATAIDPAYARTAVLKKQELAKAEYELARWDARQAELDEARSSDTALELRRKCHKLAANYERKLLIAAKAAAALRDAANDLATELRITDYGHPLSKQGAAGSIKGRTISVLGGAGGISLESFGTSAKFPGPLTEKWKG